MTQRIFDIKNEKDYADLWDIVPNYIDEIRGMNRCDSYLFSKGRCEMTIPANLIFINWHDKTEIIRPTQEATEADIGKLCYFWEKNFYHYGILTSIGTDSGKVYYVYDDSLHCNHCRRLTKQEIEELC